MAVEVAKAALLAMPDTKEHKAVSAQSTGCPTVAEVPRNSAGGLCLKRLVFNWAAKDKL